MTTPERILTLWKRGESVSQIRGITGASTDYVLQVINDAIGRRDAGKTIEQVMKEQKQ